MRYWSGWLALVLVGVTPVMTVQAQSFNFAEDEVKVATRSYKRGEYDKSLAILNKVLATDATNTDALNLRAATNYKLKNFEGSLNDYSAIIKLDEKNTRALGGRGVVYYEQGNLARAEADYTKAIEINKDQQMAVPALFFERSKVYQRQGKVDEAVNDLTIITKIMPEDEKMTKIFMERALLYFFKGKFALALTDWQKGAGLNTRNPEALTGQAIALFRIGQQEDAKTAMRAAMILEPRYGDLEWVRSTRDNGPAWHFRATEALAELLPTVK